MYAPTGGFYVLIYYFTTLLMALERIDVSLSVLTTCLLCILKCKTQFFKDRKGKIKYAAEASVQAKSTKPTSFHTRVRIGLQWRSQNVQKLRTSKGEYWIKQ